MSTTRRGFLKMLGFAGAAVAAAPVLKKVAAAEPQVDLTKSYRASKTEVRWQAFDPALYVGETKWVNNPDMKVPDAMQKLFKSLPMPDNDWQPFRWDT